jgi:ribosomal-protein-alanine N-acetyltransferase
VRTVVSLNHSDAHDMMRIHNMCFEYQPWTLTIIEDFFTNHLWGEVVAYGVRSAEQIQGYILARDVSDYAEILDFAVIPGCQKQGIGKVLLEYLLENIETRPMLLEMKVGNQSAQNLYEKHGFQAVRTISNYYQYQGHSFDAVLMKL